MFSVEINGEDWIVNGAITHSRREFKGHRIEGLLLNTRMANGIFSDANPLTCDLWRYPDTGKWDPQRNTDELIAQLPTYRAYGLDAVCVNLQGASPVGYYVSSDEGVTDLVRRVRGHHADANVDAIWAGLDGVHSQPWNTGAFEADGTLKPDFAKRAEQLVRAAAHEGLVVILGFFYFGQDERLRDEEAVRRAVVNACEWALRCNLTNVIVEINNECDVPRYEHRILTPPHVHRLIELAKSVRGDDAQRLLVGTSYGGGSVPGEAVVAASDYIALHGNSVDDPHDIAIQVDATRALTSYRGQPILFNEDDHFNFDQPDNNFVAALSRHAGWGFFDPGPGAGGTAAYGDYVVGYQNPPVNWGLNTPRKRAFFDLLRDVTGADAPGADQAGTNRDRR